MMSRQDLYQVFICVLLVSCCSQAVFGRPNKREAENSSIGPCFEIDFAIANSSSLSFDEELNKLKSRATSLQLKATELNDHILSEYSVHFTNDTIQLLNLKEFMNKDNMQDLETETEPKADALTKHHAMVNEHIQYIHATRTSGTFGSSNKITKDMLLNYETELSSFSCSISIAVLAANGELPTTTDVDLVPLFNMLGSTYHYQVFRAYLTTRDGMILASHLQVAYDQM